MAEEEYLVYWDTSAILSVLFYDKNSETSQSWIKKGENNLISTLAYAETCAVIGRIKREGTLDDLQIQEALNLVIQGPWRRINSQPEWKTISHLSKKWSLRGADLWHLVTAKTLQKELPELILLTFDEQLKKAAKGEGLVRNSEGFQKTF